MKEMEYTFKRKFEILDEGEIDGYFYLIVSYGTHPCAYVGLTQGHPCYQKDYSSDVCDINVHGGLTFSDSKVGNIEKKGVWWLGWDYAHSGDYFPIFNTPDDKKWTTEEIKNHVIDVIKQLKNMEKQDD